MTSQALVTARSIAIASAFGGWVGWQLGAESGMLYFTGLALEKAADGEEAET